jgi:hypothetical protein
MLWVALLLKEQGVTVVASCVVYDFFIAAKCEFTTASGIRQHRSTFVRTAVLIAAGAGLMFWRISLQGGQESGFDWQTHPASHHESLGVRTMTQLYYCFIHFWLMIYPKNLSCDVSGSSIPLIYSINDRRNLSTATFGAALVALALYSFSPFFAHVLATPSSKSAGKQQSKKGKAAPTASAVLSEASVDARARVGLACATMIAPYLPACGIVISIGFVIAERVMYMPSMGFIVLIVIIMQFAIDWAETKDAPPAPKKGEAAKEATQTKEGSAGLGVFALVRPLLMSAVGVIVCLYSAKTLERDLVWNNEIDLYRTAIEVYPSNAKAHHNLGTYLKDDDPSKVCIVYSV